MFHRFGSLIIIVILCGLFESTADRRKVTHLKLQFYAIRVSAPIFPDDRGSARLCIYSMTEERQLPKYGV
jgi:hypothetical protein